MDFINFYGFLLIKVIGENQDIGTTFKP